MAGKVVTSSKVEFAPAGAGGAEPGSGWIDFSKDLYDSGQKFASDEVEDTRYGAELKQMIPGLINGSISLGIRSDLEDPDGIFVFLENNFRKQVWIRNRPMGASSELVYKFRVLISKIPKVGGAVGAHSAEDTLEVNVTSQPQVSRDNGTTWTLIGGTA